MNEAPVLKPVALATLVAGTLDIAWAAVNSVLQGGTVTGMLRSVASGPFPEATGWGAAGAALGLAVHFAIMAAMAAVFVLAHAKIGWVRAHALIAGAVYGLGLWVVMYGIVLPLRFGAPFPASDPVELAKQWFAHIVLTGIAIAVVTARTFKVNAR